MYGKEQQLAIVAVVTTAHAIVATAHAIVSTAHAVRSVELTPPCGAFPARPCAVVLVAGARIIIIVTETSSLAGEALWERVLLSFPLTQKIIASPALLPCSG